MIRSLNNFPRIGDCKSKKSWCMQKGNILRLRFVIKLLLKIMSHLYRTFELFRFLCSNLFNFRISCC
jgi:hypothetical protein